MRKQDEQIVIRIASPLRRELELAAEQDQRPLAAYVRKLLIEHAEKRIVERAGTSQAA